MSINRRDFLSASLAAAAGATMALSASESAAGEPAAVQTKLSSSSTRKRNVLLIVSDDHGYDLSCCGGKVKTPVLDALIGEGVLFTDAYASVSSCSSSRATLYTGLYSHTNGMYGLAHDVHNFSL